MAFNRIPEDKNRKNSSFVLIQEEQIRPLVVHYKLYLLFKPEASKESSTESYDLWIEVI